ncbi:uncharacterized protein TRUGW13939_09252 [Talaromyces rugulosus]|uniref:Uncharacterized protein n=1 Tax=Talaromyces rugulosus TaxID=121627 RepID=A0A7H8R7B9_TALRU|nr:uncharacterized protein TRUGW13939_09252 [Talaromyces rugulosus]QKX62096.1 hypothetical protein TRUGW13939_09252 [Talaromyces rugulosus]
MAALEHYLASRGTATSSALGPGAVITIILYLIAAVLVQYVYGQVFTMLAAVEDPSPNIYMHASINAVENSIDKRPITSSPSSIIKHLKAHGGRLSCFRGFWLYLLISVTGGIIVSLFCLLGSVGYHLGSFMATPIVSALQVGWIHLVISKPSTKTLWSRIPPFRWIWWSRIASAAFLRSIAVQLVAWVIAPIASTMSTGLIPNRDNIYQYVFGKVGLLSLGLILYVLIQMPAEATFIRVAASMLPDDDETIVPFDRSFGGKVTPKIVGGSGRIGILDAWRSFNRESQVLVVKAVGWNFGLQIALLFAFAIVFILQTLI